MTLRKYIIARFSQKGSHDHGRSIFNTFNDILIKNESNLLSSFAGNENMFVPNS